MGCANNSSDCGMLFATPSSTMTAGMQLCRILVAALVAATLPACGEHSQRLAAAEKPGYVTDGWRDQLRQRTQRQHESGRIYQ